MTAPYVTLPEAARLSGLRLADLQERLLSGELPHLPVGEEPHVPQTRVHEIATRSSSRPIMVVQGDFSGEEPKATRSNEQQLFEDATGVTPTEYLQQWHAGTLAFSDDNARLAVRAEDLLARF